MAKCPYCSRPLHHGIRCRACRRYVLRWPHIAVLTLVLGVAVVFLLELLFRVT
ncbi:MAG TPA: hypothetical protein VEY09_05445 [Pyrinomonadaceae bacterium]|nr:hypothetical protein [Pyrinomonadaceae bacterium]